MKRYLYAVAILLLLHHTPIIAQVEFYNNGTTVRVESNTLLYVNGNFTNNAGSSYENNGTVELTGNLTNNQAMSSHYSGTIKFIGTNAQTIDGTQSFLVNHAEVNNASGVILNNTVKVDGTCTFTNGIVTASATSAPLWFTANGTHSSAADASHVNGYVVKEGTGSFIYPVGDGVKYQKCAVNPTANGTGIQVKYNATDAGAGTFTNSGTEATPLYFYNRLEHWNITPLSTATGTVTMYWDNYNNIGIASAAHLKVAHKASGNWLNEGTTGTGLATSGSVTSNSLSTWSPFTLGSISSASTLPLYWLNVNGSLNAQKQTIINWQVQESNVANYAVEKSIDGITFNSIVTVNSKGYGTNIYNYTDVQAVNGIVYYRIKQIGVDGRINYSTIIKLSNQQVGKLSVYPNPIKDVFTLSVDNSLLNSLATLIDSKGAVIKQIKITQLQMQINVSELPKGTYIIKTTNGTTLKLIKE
jgi:Secretion system C-terminal sorting domain